MIQTKVNYRYAIRDIIALYTNGLYNLPGRYSLKLIMESKLHWTKKIEWAKNIKNYVGPKRENKNWLYVLYNGNLEIINKKIKEKSDRVQGGKNPWANHAGKYSPYKQGSVNYSEEAIQKANKNRSHTTQLEYYLKQGMTEAEAKEALSDRQKTFTLEKCIHRYGAEEGTRLYNDRQERWLATLDAKSDEEKVEINKKKATGVYKKTSKAISLVEKEILSKIPELTSQKVLQRIDDPTRRFIYDFQYQNKIIEYNGDYWHANPEIYNSGDLQNRRGCDPIMVDNIWEKDKLKLDTAAQHGFEVLVVWERDYKKNKEKCIADIRNFITPKT